MAQVDPVIPPEGAAVGERITFEGHEGEPEVRTADAASIHACISGVAPSPLTRSI